MVCGLVYLAVGRNVKFSAKTLNHTKFLLQRKLPAQVVSCPGYSQGGDEDKDKEKEKEKEKVKAEPKKKEPKPTFADGKSHLTYVVEQAKKGKVSVSDLTMLASRVVTEGQMKNYKQAPQTVQYIAFATLAPMLGIPVLTLLSGHAYHCCVFTHLACGATLLSFMGGSSWYEAISRNEISYTKLGWTVAPQVLGMSSLILPIPLGILVASLGFCISLAHDILLTTYPPWMKSLRLLVTTGTVASLALMLLFYLVL